MTTKIGRLNKRVTFERQVRTPDGSGGTTVSWSTLYTVAGSHRPQFASERLESGRLESATPGVLTVRSSSDLRSVTTSDRVQIDSIAHQIRSITNPDQRNRFLEIVVEEGVAQ